MTQRESFTCITPMLHVLPTQPHKNQKEGIMMTPEQKRVKYGCYAGNISMSVVGNLSPLLFLTFRDLYGIHTVGLRYFNVFGRRQDPVGAYASVIPKFISALMRHESPVIYGDGSCSRDFTYIDNVLQANQLALLADDPAALDQVYNVAYGEQTDLLQLFRLIREFLSEYDPEVSRIEPRFAANRQGDIPHSLADISRAQTLLGYSPAHSIRSGLKETVAWYFKNQTP